jgi:hypothetical protein
MAQSRSERSRQQENQRERRQRSGRRGESQSTPQRLRPGVQGEQAEYGRPYYGGERGYGYF